MLTILHGDHQLQSRNALYAALERAKTQGREITRIEAKQLEPGSLFTMAGAQSLFGESAVIVINELHSLPKSKKKEALIEEVAQAAAHQLILWEKKQLSATELKHFAGAQVQLFQPARVMFTWLGSVTGQPNTALKSKNLSLLKQAIETDGEQFCFAMLVRQVRLLMDAKAEHSSTSSPKLLSQAEQLSWPQLFWLHKQLLLIDEKQKNSDTPFNLSGQLELLIVEL